MRSAVAVAVVLWLNVYAALAELVPRLVSKRQPITLPIQVLKTRDIVGANGQEGSGLSPVSMSSDRQSYFTIIKVGEVHLRVALDTASSDLWVISSDCTTAQCKKVPRYPLSYQSPTFVALNNNATVFNASYADGSLASGFVAEETIQLANLTLPEQPFGIATQSNVTFIDQVSGIMGLGFTKLSSISTSTNSTPFFPTLAYKGLLEYPIFSLSLRKNDTGSLSIGKLSPFWELRREVDGLSRVASFPPFVNEVNETVATYLQWAIPLTSLAVNQTTVTPTSTYPSIGGGRSLALIDAGASGIYGPFQDVSKLFALIDGARLVDTATGQWVVPCGTLVPIIITFGTARYTLLPEDYIIGPASGNPNLCLAWPRASPPSADGIDWQLGAPFLRTVYSIYSFGINSKEPPMIGFYPLGTNLTQSPTPEPGSTTIPSTFATVLTTLPNVLLPTPTYNIPPYLFNSSIPALVGAVVSSGLATSTYSAIFGTRIAFNASALPTIAPEPTISTLVITDPSGQVQTSFTTFPMAAVTLGVPPGGSSGTSLLATAKFSWPTLLLTCTTLLFWVDTLL